MRVPETKLIAFYLPQFHPVPENDQWWGKGFTEWRNVVRARPLFSGHYQPHLPADLGFYDLRVPEVREEQAAIARQYGVEGFCYYHYWFNGRRILERPFNDVLASGRPDFPFCLCWANENWTRVWDGGEKHILLQQRYSDEDDIHHFQTLVAAFSDERYIRIDGKPLFLVYRGEQLADPRRTTSTWRELARRAGFPGLYLARVESYESVVAREDPRNLGFDGEVEFPPFSWNIGAAIGRSPVRRTLQALSLDSDAFSKHLVIPYEQLVRGMLGRESPDWPRFRSVTPSWDNTARRSAGASIFHGSSPDRYEDWLATIIQETLAQRAGEERIVFINAWNEWAEGNHLEPDLKWGLGYLEATLSALQRGERPRSNERGAPAARTDTDHSSIKRLYWNYRSKARSLWR